MTIKSSHIATNLGFALTLVILACLALSCLLSARAFVQSKHLRKTARQRSLELYDLWNAVEAAETSQRGYLLTHDPAYLLPGDGARERAHASFGRLRALYPSDAPALQELATLQDTFDHKFDELDETVRLSKTGNNEAAIEIVKSNYGQNLTAKAREDLQRLKSGCDHELELLRTQSDAVLSRGFWAVGSACILAMMALVAAMLVVSHDNRRRRRIEADLRTANIQAQQATAAKSMFLATMSHELRTPLNAICGMSDLLVEGQLDTEHRGFAEVIQQAALALLALVNDILDFSKIEAGKLELEAEPFAPRQLVEMQLDIVRGQALKRNLALLCEIDPNLPPMLSGDRGRLGQILLNLLSNAVKFTKSGSVTVRVTSAAAPAADAVIVRMEVVDTGIGLSEAQMAQLFQAFSQVHNGNYGGTGLGLAICRRLIGLMDGTVGVRANPSGGSIFWLELPLAIARIQPPVPAPTLEPHAELTRAIDQALKPLATKQGHILVAEDNAVNRLLISKQLERLGYRADIVNNGAEALDAVARQSYDLVLMDCQMPEMDGYEASRRIREQETKTGKHVPILALTANAVRGDAEKCAAAGMDGHLTKPIRKELLAQTIQDCIARHPA